MKRTLHLKVTDQVSTLNRITSAFVRLQYNINELTVKPAKEEGFSDMFIVANIKDEKILKVLIAKLKKQVNVLEIKDITPEEV
ncbi:ACT domain-containing protein [Staphylococcus devriesei]|uniref:acetolactate synthase n=1 Tax=Staphylococcus devriesei TaxID=586733 RepID=A0A2K4DS61_9STAP|nr:ACT domain-containing protein [Staphylococcus devriesei]MCE5091022.1 ACT domain-containing protein [Staphylococcus devriesei]MCE5097954.1 ACT domain-containing protein [Staphylococcus devriesei]PNZ89648.1 acetolactate synthase 1 regulatory subunit [Staphylococcus devriesei]PTE71736.1 ACT domain-containing protein [Staphylococcus devriesei]PTF13909.1 ACT domain-containing protein [Staphylococcus devriesei]